MAVALPALMLPPVTFRPALAVRLAPLPIVKVPLLEVPTPVTLPAPFQLPVAKPTVPASVPPARLMVPPVTATGPLTVPPPDSVPVSETLPVIVPALITPVVATVTLPLTVPAPDSVPASERLPLIVPAFDRMAPAATEIGLPAVSELFTCNVPAEIVVAPE